jgi:prevent-host-death family protein
MREIAISEAKARLPEFIAEVERGATIRITRHGRAVARLVPEEEARKQEAHDAVEAIREIGRRTKGMTLDELLAARDEGRRF